MKKIIYIIIILMLLLGCEKEKAEFDNDIDMVICNKLCQEKHNIYVQTSYYSKGLVTCYCDDALQFNRSDYSRMYK